MLSWKTASLRLFLLHQYSKDTPIKVMTPRALKHLLLSEWGILNYRYVLRVILCVELRSPTSRVKEMRAMADSVRRSFSEGGKNKKSPYGVT
jgi:hypothetical protein